MKKVIECKVSLMEKDKDFSVNKEGKGNYIVRSSGRFLPNEYFKKWGVNIKEDFDQEEYNFFIGNAITTIYGDLIAESKNKLDSVGIWITFDDESVVENSMDISILDSIREYGQEGIIPILEFVKMTLQSDESEVDL